MTSLLKILLTNYTHCYSRLAYNLNWLDIDWYPFAQFLSFHSINVVDVGARGGISPELENMRSFLAYHGFDADEEEARRLTNLGDPRCAYYQVFPNFIGSHVGQVDFNVCVRPGNSSVLEPAATYREKFGGPTFVVSHKISITSTTLDKLIGAGTIPAPDFLKLDTQGNEFEILDASPKTLDQVSLIETEVEFIPFYEGQKLFHDISKLLYERGFELLYLNRVFQSRWKHDGQCRGQITFGDALFGRTEESLTHLSAEQKAKYVLLLWNFGHFDLAAAIVAKHPDVLKLVPQLAKSQHAWRGKFSQLKRGLVMQLDKLITLLLHLRRTNQLRGDSDRTWPIR